MKILIVSDLHGSTSSSEKIISLDEVFHFKKIILLGDVNYSGARNVPPEDYFPINVTKNLNKINKKIVFIRGNCDSRVDEFVFNKKFVNKRCIVVDGHHWFLTHGDLYFEDNFEYKDGDAFIYGHTHVYKLEKHNNHYFINPGSLSLPKENNPKTYIIYEDGVFSLYDINDKKIKSL